MSEIDTVSEESLKWADARLAQAHDVPAWPGQVFQAGNLYKRAYAALKARVTELEGQNAHIMQGRNEEWNHRLNAEQKVRELEAKVVAISAAAVTRMDMVRGLEARLAGLKDGETVIGAKALLDSELEKRQLIAERDAAIQANLSMQGVHNEAVRILSDKLANAERIARMELEDKQRILGEANAAIKRAEELQLKLDLGVAVAKEAEAGTVEVSEELGKLAERFEEAEKRGAERMRGLAEKVIDAAQADNEAVCKSVEATPDSEWHPGAKSSVVATHGHIGHTLFDVGMAIKALPLD